MYRLILYFKIVLFFNNQAITYFKKFISVKKNVKIISFSALLYLTLTSHITNLRYS